MDQSKKRNYIWFGVLGLAVLAVVITAIVLPLKGKKPTAGSESASRNLALAAVEQPSRQVSPGFATIHDIAADTAALRPLRFVILQYFVPDHFDTRIKFGKQGLPNSSGILGCISAALDQGDCGSSWAFAVAGVASDRIRIESSVPSASGMALMHDQLSPQFLMSEGNQCLALRNRLRGSRDISCQTGTTCQLGCNALAFKFLAENGAIGARNDGAPNDAYIDLYRLRGFYNVALDIAGEENYYFFPGQRPVRAETQYVYQESNVNTMKELMTRGPVCTCINVYSDLFEKYGDRATTGVKNDEVYYPADGVVPRAGHINGAGIQYLGDQACAIIGWGRRVYYDATNPILYWIVRMTWGPQWNGDGTMKIVRGQNAFNIELSMLGSWGYDIVSEAPRPPQRKLEANEVPHSLPAASLRSFVDRD